MEAELTVIRERLVAIEQERLALKAEEDKLTTQLRAGCTHPLLIAWPAHVTGEYLKSYWHERRICGFCAWEEEGKYGFQKLRGPVAHIVREGHIFYQFRTIQPFQTIELLAPLVPK